MNKGKASVKTMPKRSDGIKAAEQGLVQAQYNLGDMYEQGQGVRQDYAEAFRWYRKAAEQD